MSKEKQREYRRRYYLKHREKLLRGMKEKYWGNREAFLEHRRQYKKDYNSRESVKQKASVYYQGRKEAFALSHQKYQWKIKLSVLQLLGGKCRSCGNTDFRVLQINHENGRNGERWTGYSSYLRVLSGERQTDDLELLCANCNIIYEYERKHTYRLLGDG